MADVSQKRGLGCAQRVWRAGPAVFSGPSSHGQGLGRLLPVGDGQSSVQHNQAQPHSAAGGREAGLGCLGTNAVHSLTSELSCLDTPP